MASMEEENGNCQSCIVMCCGLKFFRMDLLVHMIKVYECLKILEIQEKNLFTFKKN